MKISFIIPILLFSSLAVFGQINVLDSTVQVITYWNKGEKQNYSVLLDYYKIKDLDTIEVNQTSYDVEITILDSSANAYIVQWHNSNFISNRHKSVMQNLLSSIQDINFIFKVDEMGVFIEIINWEEVRKKIQKAAKKLRKRFKKSNKDYATLLQLEGTYSTKEAIENFIMKDIQQFHFFYGTGLKLGELIETQMEIPNLFGPKPYKASLLVSLDEIDEGDNTYIIRSKQEVDSVQLANAALNYYTTLANRMNTAPPPREAFNDLKNEILTFYCIHGTGWVIYCSMTTTLKLDNYTHIEKCIIKLK